MIVQLPTQYCHLARPCRIASSSDLNLQKTPFPSTFPAFVPSLICSNDRSHLKRARKQGVFRTAAVTELALRLTTRTVSCSPSSLTSAAIEKFTVGSPPERLTWRTPGSCECPIIACACIGGCTMACAGVYWIFADSHNGPVHSKHPKAACYRCCCPELVSVESAVMTKLNKSVGVLAHQSSVRLGCARRVHG